MVNCKQMLMDGGKSQTSKVRDERIDSVKYWLIVLVIIGHVFEEFKSNPECKLIWDYIYIFHMPLFIFISGYFSRKKNWKEFMMNIWKLLEPLLIFHALALIPKFISDNHVPLTVILTPRWILWYLLSLIYWRLLMQIIPNKILNNDKLILTLTFIISITAGFTPFNRILSIQRTLAFMPFFFMGYYIQGKSLYLSDKYKPYSFLFLITMITIPLFFSQYLGNLTHAVPYKSFDEAIKRIIVFGLSIPMSVAFINICPDIRWSRVQGKLTMQYYIYHALAITPLMIIASKLNIPMSFVSATIYTIVITIGIGIASRLPYFTKFTNPSSFFKK